MSSNSTILIVDDENMNLKVLRAMLIPEGYNVIEAAGGQEALTLADEKQPDLILLDVIMPGMNGFEVCSILKQKEAAGKNNNSIIPVVMVTALKEKKDRIQAQNAGADDFLTKPVDRIELIIRVKSLLRIKTFHDNLIESYKKLQIKNKELEKLERIKESLTHMIIHDLSNPLSAISMTIELLMLTKENFNEKQVAKLKKCLNYCSDLHTLINSILDIYTMEEQELKLNKQNVNFNDLSDEVIKQFIPISKSRQIKLLFKKSAGHLNAFLDTSLIKRVLANLLNNAFKHTSNNGVNGVIEIFAKKFDKKREIEVVVKDNGSGISSEYIEKIFNRFEQAELKERGLKTGQNGLGLAFCKMAVERHGGRIRAESKGKGKGSKFIFTIPV